MIRIIFSEKFLSKSKKISFANQNKLARLLDLLKIDPFHPLLHSKKLSGRLNCFYSFRINRNLRVIFIFEEENTIKLIRIGDRKDIYKS